MGTKNLPCILQQDLRWLPPLDSCPCHRSLAEKLHFLLLLHTRLPTHPHSGSSHQAYALSHFLTPPSPGPWPLLISQPPTAASESALLLPSYLGEWGSSLWESGSGKWGLIREEALVIFRADGVVHLERLLEIKNGVTACTGWLNLIPHTSPKRRKKD